MTPNFEGTYDAERQEARVRLLGDFQEEEWPDLEAAQLAWFEQGLRQYVLDLTSQQNISSRVIGLFVGLNARLALRGGRLRIKMLEGSGVASLVNLMRLHKLMDVECLRKLPDPTPAEGEAAATDEAAAPPAQGEAAPAPAEGTDAIAKEEQPS